MDVEAPVLLGLAAALFGVVDTLPYIRDTLRHSTCPHRGTWMIWTVLAAVALLSQRADGATWSLALVASQTLLCGAICVLAIRFGMGGVSRADGALIALAFSGVASWAIASDPLVATACVVVADLIAAAMMVPKTWRDPGSETLSTYVLASAGGLLAAASVGAPDVALLLYPVYYCVANGALALLIHHRRAVLAAGYATAGVGGPSSFSNQ